MAKPGTCSAGNSVARMKNPGEIEMNQTGDVKLKTTKPKRPVTFNLNNKAEIKEYFEKHFKDGRNR